MRKYSESHICQCLTRISTLKRNSPVTVLDNRKQTGEQFVEGVLSLANGLLALGLTTGDVVAISAFNSDLYLQWLLAVAFVGGIIAPLNYRWSFEEAQFAMSLVKPVMLVTDESSKFLYLKIQKDALPSLRWHVLLDYSSLYLENTQNVYAAEALQKHSPRSLSINYCWAPNGAVIICFTSGTTGRPKGVTISHSALITQSLAKIAIVGYSDDDIYLHTAPLCHIGGISSALAMLMVGACHVIMPKFDVKSTIEAIKGHQVTALISVPAMMADMISLISSQESWKSSESVKKILNGGGALSVKLTKDVAKYFPRAKILSAYGMTETCSSLTFMTLYNPVFATSGQLHSMSGKAKPQSFLQTHGVCVGKPAPHVELRICFDGSSNAGKILTRGPHVMLGYWDPSQSRACNSSNEAWFNTGDVGSIDDNGNLWLIGRANGRIKSGGENVYPEEVERVLIRHPGLNNVVVLGIPDARLTEKVVACIKLRESWKWSDRQFEDSIEGKELTISGKILKQYCREKNLTGFKIPRTFVLWKEPFPVTTSGKIKRSQLRDEVISLPHHLPSSL